MAARKVVVSIEKCSARGSRGRIASIKNAGTVPMRTGATFVEENGPKSEYRVGDYIADDNLSFIDCEFRVTLVAARRLGR